MTSRQILAHHRSLAGRLRYRYLDSEALGLRKPFYVYEPPGLKQATGPIPLLYLFRGHEREWVNMEEDQARQRRTAIGDLDILIASGALPPVIAVMPGLNSTNNHVPSLGVDMVGPWDAKLNGLGTGQFWTFLTDELIPRVERDYPQATGASRLAAGFSLGGYTVSLLAVQRPALFDHVGIYDGLLMWPRHEDPRQPRPAGSSGGGERATASPDSDRPWASTASSRPASTDPIWGQVGLFDAALGRPRDHAAMARWNPTDRLVDPAPTFLERLQAVTFWIACAPQDGQHGNLHRSRAFAQRLRELDVPVGFEEVVLHPEARHDWHWADRFMIRFLERTLPA
ncbi:MAG: alpha/beta hydrolase-fold protein [Bacteroidota bacterium]